jgi:hypothetical protein
MASVQLITNLNKLDMFILDKEYGHTDHKHGQDELPEEFVGDYMGNELSCFIHLSSE